MSIDNLPPLREVIERHDLIPKKSLGQNFLFDLNLTSKIARQAGNLQDQPVIEVGPGPGGLTRALLAQGAIVTAIERDERCLDALAEIEAHYPGRLRIISGDALEQDFKALFPDGPKPRIVANLPYNVGTQLLLNWLLTEPWPPFYSSMTLMFQREVGERIVAAPDTDHYGRLGVLAGWRTHSKIAFDVPHRRLRLRRKLCRRSSISRRVKSRSHVARMLWARLRRQPSGNAENAASEPQACRRRTTSGKDWN